MIKKIIFIVIFIFCIHSIILSDSLTLKKNKEYFVLAKSGLVLRTAPSVTAKKIGLLPYNSTIKILEITSKKLLVSGISNNWVKVNCNSKKRLCFCGIPIPL